MKIGRQFNHSIFIILTIVSACCIILLIMSTVNLPDISISRNNDDLSKIEGKNSKDEKTLGKFGEMMIEMLPNDLPFTVFVPSEKTFERDLRLRDNHNFTSEEWENAYATVSHVLGFSTVPRKVYADLLHVGKYLSYDSISGLTLSISKGFDGVLDVNSVKAEGGYVKRGELVVYVMDGVIMDAEFEQAVRPDDNQEEQDSTMING